MMMMHTPQTAQGMMMMHPSMMMMQQPAFTSSAAPSMSTMSHAEYMQQRSLAALQQQHQVPATTASGLPQPLFAAKTSSGASPYGAGAAAKTASATTAESLMNQYKGYHNYY